MPPTGDVLVVGANLLAAGLAVADACRDSRVGEFSARAGVVVSVDINRVVADGGCGKRLVARVRLVLVAGASRRSARVIASADTARAAVDAGERHRFGRCRSGCHRPCPINRRRTTRRKPTVREHVALRKGAVVAVRIRTAGEIEQRSLGGVQHDPATGTAAAKLITVSSNCSDFTTTLQHFARHVDCTTRTSACVVVRRLPPVGFHNAVDQATRGVV